MKLHEKMKHVFWQLKKLHNRYMPITSREEVRVIKHKLFELKENFFEVFLSTIMCNNYGAHFLIMNA